MIWQGLIFGMTTMAFALASQTQAKNASIILEGGKFVDTITKSNASDTSIN